MIKMIAPAQLIALLIFFTCHIAEVLGELCGENLFCQAPYRCCERKHACCYDNMLHTNRHLRLQIWNMWYFWFLVIFMMMSCFGGCGYYRRRRTAMFSGANHSTNRTDLVSSLHRTTNRDHSMRGGTVTAFIYSGPGTVVTLPATALPLAAAMPPAYSEVVNQPGLYPVNKSELPPYPGNKPDDTAQDISMPAEIEDSSELDDSPPPPYSEHQHVGQSTDSTACQTQFVASNPAVPSHQAIMSNSDNNSVAQ